MNAHPGRHGPLHAHDPLGAARRREAAAQLRTRLDQLAPRKGILYVDGPSGAGKSELLREFGDSTQGVVFVDAAGRSAEEAADAVMHAIGVAYGDDRSLRTLTFLVEDLVDDGEFTPKTVLVANTQWAGKVRSSREPLRVAAGGIVGQFGSNSEDTAIKLVVEVDSEIHDLGPRNQSPVRLAPAPAPGSTDATEPAQPSLDSLPPRHRTAVTALALAEPYRVRFEEWQFLCSALGTEFDLDELRTIGAESVFVSVDHPTDLPVGFAYERDARTLRGEVAADAGRAFQQAVVDRLFACGDGDRLHDYVRRGLPAHAALAGRFEELLADPRTLVRCDHTALLDALRVAFPDSVPAGTFAAELYYLGNFGVAPSSHAEWVSLLHLLALSRGDQERARALADAAGPLPWRTVWTHWRAPGQVRAVPPQIGVVGALRAEPDATTVTSFTTNGFRQAWHAPTGQLLAATGRFTASQGQPAEEPAGYARPTSPAPTRWRPERSWNLVRLSAADDPSRVRVVQAPLVKDVACVGDLVILGGTAGIYAVEPGPAYAEAGTLPALPALTQHMKVTPCAFDASACRPTRARVLDLFGADIAPLLTEEQLPAGLTHEPTRRFLTEVGLPAVSGFHSLTTHNLAGTGFVEHTWEGTKEFETPVGDGPFYELGTWIGGVLLLDGPTGRVLRQSRKGAVDDRKPGDPLAGSSLDKFTAMLCLQWTYMTAYATTSGVPDGEGDDLVDELRSWLACIDPAAAATRNWGHVTDTDELR